MQLGWIDFSKEDRQKALDVINLLSEQGAVDELGIGIIRDAFANYFFPGTSTIQNRAKYFLIVPYVLREAVDGRYEERILRDIQNGITLEKLNMRKRKKTPEEKAAVLKMKRKHALPSSPHPPDLCSHHSPHGKTIPVSDCAKAAYVHAF